MPFMPYMAMPTAWAEGLPKLRRQSSITGKQRRAEFKQSSSRGKQRQAEVSRVQAEFKQRKTEASRGKQR